MESFPIIDFHVHCFPDELAQRAVNSVYKSIHQANGTLSCQIECMKHYCISKCVALNIASRVDTMNNVNTFAESIQSETVISFGSIHPDAEDAFDALDRIYKRGIRGVKFHTAHQAFDFDDPKYIPLYNKIGQMGMMTLVHCGPSSKSNEHCLYPNGIAKVIDAFSGAPFIAAHFGGLRIKDAEFELLCQLPVYVDTALAFKYMDVQEFSETVDCFGEDRVLFGSDLPWGDYEGTYNLIINSHLSRRTKEKILFKNAQAILDRYGY